MIRFVEMQQLPDGIDRLGVVFDRVFVGDEIDDRGRRSLELARASGACVVRVRYDPASFELMLDGQPIRVSDIDQIRQEHPGHSILMDATSLDAVELLILTRAFLHCDEPRRIGYLYVEPGRYLPSADDIGMDFEYTFAEEFRGLQPVPGFAGELRADDTGRLVACLGFEPDRLVRILQDDDGNFIKHTTLVFGVPPYRTTWEMHALLPHERVISQNRSQCEVAFAGAANPKATFERLKEVARAVGDGERLLIAPLGSKPSSIGLALFACCRDDVRLKYDFPVRLAGRTEGVGTAHLYLVAQE